MNTKFNELLSKSAKDRRNLSTDDIKMLKDVDLTSELWTPGKTAKALEVMQIALKLEKKDEFN